MTKKHFVSIAKGFQRQLVALDGAAVATGMNADLIATIRAVIRASAEMFADVAKADNAAFDRARFLTACGF